MKINHSNPAGQVEKPGQRTVNIYSPSAEEEVWSHRVYLKSRGCRHPSAVSENATTGGIAGGETSTCVLWGTGTVRLMTDDFGFSEDEGKIYG